MLDMYKNVDILCLKSLMRIVTRISDLLGKH